VRHHQYKASPTQETTNQHVCNVCHQSTCTRITPILYINVNKIRHFSHVQIPNQPQPPRHIKVLTQENRKCMKVLFVRAKWMQMVSVGGGSCYLSIAKCQNVMSIPSTHSFGVPCWLIPYDFILSLSFFLSLYIYGSLQTSYLYV